MHDTGLDSSLGMGCIVMASGNPFTAFDEIRRVGFYKIKKYNKKYPSGESVCILYDPAGHFRCYLSLSLSASKGVLPLCAPWGLAKL